MADLASALIVNGLQAYADGTQEHVEDYVYHILEQVEEDPIPTVLQLCQYAVSMLMTISEMTCTDPIELWANFLNED